MDLKAYIAGFEHSPIPTWIALIEPIRLIWANPPAVELWSASSLEELLARDHSGASETSRKQAKSWLEGFRAGTLDPVEVEWTFYPRGVPRRVRMFISGIELGEDYALLQHAILKANTIAPEILRGAEAIRHTSLAVTTLTSSGEVISRNPAMQQAFGYDSPPQQWFTEPAVHEAVLEVGRHGQAYRAEVHSAPRQGQPRSYSLEARKTVDPVSGEPAILVQMLDETARVGAELEAARKAKLVDELQQALATVEDQQQRWRALVESAPDVIAIVDREHQVEFVNRSLTGAEAMGSAGPLEQLFDPGQHGELSAILERAFTTGEIQTYEAKTRQGERGRQHSLRIGPIGSGEDIERLTLISTDVTEQRELEEQLRHSQKMQAVGTLAGGVAHDFNNLLTIIGGACELAQLEVPDSEGELTALLEEIKSASERAAALTRRLLTFSRRQVTQPKDFDLSELVREMSKLLFRVIGEHLSLQLHFDERPCWIRADPGQLEQVVLNLSVNARDAMPEGGTLTITTSRSDDTGEVLLEVRDTGVGIDAELAERIFEPFFTTKAEGKGTGLGLAMVHGIVEAAGGRIALDSTPGKGSSFGIRLPQVSPPTVEAAARAPGVHERGRGQLILLVEDEDAVRQVVARKLALLGYRCLSASCLSEALAHARAAPKLDLLLSDIVLAGESGADVRDAVVALHPELRVLFMSGYANDDVLRRGIVDGRERLLRKPFSIEQLGATLAECLAN